MSYDSDLALRCVTGTLSEGNKDKFAEPEMKRVKTDNDNDETLQTDKGDDNCMLAGITIALCCHHRCTWKSYVGKEFMQKCGFSARDFQILCKLSGWTAATWKGWTTRAEMEREIGCDDASDYSDRNCSTEARKKASYRVQLNSEASEKGTDNMSVTLAGSTTIEEDKELQDEKEGDGDHKMSEPLTR